MLFNTRTLCLALVALVAVSAQISLPSIPGFTSTASITTSAAGTSAAATSVPLSTTQAVQPSGEQTTRSRGSVIGTTTNATASATPSAIPPPKDDDNSTLLMAGIVVGSVVLAAAIGIWVFRKWKLSPSRDFQSKIRGDDYTDYPRSYENDTVYLRPIGDASVADPTPIKSPYAAAGVTHTPDDQYYDANYANEPSGYGQGNYGHQNYDQGYNNGYGHDNYSQGDYAQSQVGGYNQSGYSSSNATRGFGYDEYGRR